MGVLDIEYGADAALETLLQSIDRPGDNDPAAEGARFPLRADLRAHLHRIIEYNRLDVDHETERRSRPYTLVCTKNRASYKRRLVEYSKDVSWMRRLIRSAPGGPQVTDCAPDLARLQAAVAASGRT